MKGDGMGLYGSGEGRAGKGREGRGGREGGDGREGGAHIGHSLPLHVLSERV